MTEELNIIAQTKSGKYEELIPQVAALVSGEEDLIANLANISSALKQSFNFFWVGFYIVKKDQLVLGPFQGSIACTRINKGRGVCGTAWQDCEVLIVPNVDEFPGHIACSSSSKSEIVLPITKDNEVVLILDIDSDQLNDFDEVDKTHLLRLVKIIEQFI
jgi:L-methionine (R)-S-oxide reductase